MKKLDRRSYSTLLLLQEDYQWYSKRVKASKVEGLLSPVAYLMYARLSVITVCRQIELTVVRAMLKYWKGCKNVVNYGLLQYFEWQ